jgi:hypothetical protein
VPSGNRKRADDALILALVCGATVEMAAQKAGISARTAYRRLEDPSFQQRLNSQRADVVRRTANMLTAAGSEAVRTLLSLLLPTTPASVRLGAARTILEIAIKYQELTELREHIANLENRLAATKAGSPSDQD